LWFFVTCGVAIASLPPGYIRRVWKKHSAAEHLQRRHAFAPNELTERQRHQRLQIHKQCSAERPDPLARNVERKDPDRRRDAEAEERDPASSAAKPMPAPTLHANGGVSLCR
jgi:hypothetical protein